MKKKDSYKARLIFSSRTAGLFNWPSGSHEWTLPSGHKATLFARHADALDQATELHIDVFGFKSPGTALEVGETLRGALRLANAVLGLGLVVPSEAQEKPKLRVSEHVKNRIEEAHGARVADCVFGLNVLREADEIEYATQGRLRAKPSDSRFILEATTKLWSVHSRLDDLSSTACELLNSALQDASPRSAFLTTFLALDLLLERRPRSDQSLALLDRLIERVEKSRIDVGDRNRLKAYLGGGKRTGLSAEIEQFALTGNNNDLKIGELTLLEFLKDCNKVRQRLAHPSKEPNADILDSAPLHERAVELRKIVLAIVWARNGLPDFQIDRPSDVVSMDTMTLTVY